MCLKISLCSCGVGMRLRWRSAGSGETIRN
jgi:hypothetical protein